MRVGLSRAGHVTRHAIRFLRCEAARLFEIIVEPVLVSRAKRRGKCEVVMWRYAGMRAHGCILKCCLRWLRLLLAYTRPRILRWRARRRLMLNLREWRLLKGELLLRELLARFQIRKSRIDIFHRLDDLGQRI